MLMKIQMNNIDMEPCIAGSIILYRKESHSMGRFQPSTISVLRLNFCVRDGNRWIPQAIVTGNQAELGFFCFRLLSRRLSQIYPHPQNRTGPLSLRSA